MHTLIFFQPGHFHAALTLRIPNPRVSEEVHLYATASEERDAFVALVDAFNSRAQNPTRWHIVEHRGEDERTLLAQLIAERRGDAVVLAGRNDHKLAVIAAVHRAGLHVLADKPWAINALATDDLAQATQNGALAMDIMTSRFDVIAQLRRKIARDATVFGGFRNSADPAIDIGSVHHLVKVVNGQTLRRPTWYFDVGAQGDGLVDIQSHMTHQAQWLLETDAAYQYGADVSSLRAVRWPTPVSVELFQRSTGASEFPAALQGNVNDGELALFCNGQIDYELRGVTVRQRAKWRPIEPEGGGDLHDAVIRGENADIIVEQGPATGYQPVLSVLPRAAHVPSTLANALGHWQRDFPGVSVDKKGDRLELNIPSTLRTGHEAHFAMVLESFLDYLDAGEWPSSLRAEINMRYTLLGRAHADREDLLDEADLGDAQR
ncbi:MAG: putative dehydrogenase [Gammaproteobacteria bacterium]|jgi:predicted dehydrogenase